MLQRAISALLLAGLVTASAGMAAVHAADPVPPQSPIIIVQDSCASACQAQHDRCRVETKGSPSCDAARQRCLQACLAQRKR